MTSDNSSNGPQRFGGKVALVVGGAQGIGKAIALRLGREAAKVVIADLDAPMMEATVREMQTAGFEACQIPCDVRDAKQVRAMTERALACHGVVDILMYVAGIAPAVSFLEMNEEVWDSTLDTNLRGAFLVARALAPSMVARRSGKLVFMASTNCWDAEARLAHYNASKAGLFLLAKTLARELGPYGINSNAVGPGFIRTRLTDPVLNDKDFLNKYAPENGLIPLGRLGTPEDVTGPALFLASLDASYVNGVLLLVDGGQLA